MKNIVTFLRSLALFALFFLTGNVWGQITWANTGASTAWYTAANWSPSTASGAWTTSNVAQFANAGTATTAGINMGTASLSIGAIEVTSARTRVLTIGNSSATTGTLTLNGVAVNAVSNVIVRNASGSLLTLQDNETGTGKTMNVVLANTTNNVFVIDGAGGITISSVISGSGRNLTKDGSGAGVLTLTGANTYSGTTTIKAGTLRLGAAGVIADASNMILDGGTFSTGATAGFAETVGTLDLNTSSTIALGTGSHNINFAASNGVSWAGSVLTITGWAGTIGAGTTGTAGRVFVGSTAAGLTAAQLAKIKFTISGVDYPATILSTGEVVPTLKYAITAISPASPTAGSGFSVTVRSQDFNNNFVNVVGAGGSTFTLTTNGNAGAISGTTSGTITSGTSTVTIIGVVLASAGTAVTLTATRSSGDILIAATSSTFTVTSAVTANVALSVHNTVSAANVSQGTNSVILSSVKWDVTTSAATVTAVDFALLNTSTYTSSDLKSTPFKLWYSSSSTFASATQIGTSQATSGGAPETISFTGLSTTIAVATTGYFWFTVDIANAATVGRTVLADQSYTSDFTFSGSVNKTGSAATPGTQTVIAALPLINVKGNSVSIATGSISTSTTDHTDFGNVAWGANFSRTFTIENNAPSGSSGSLSLSGTPRVVVSGANASDFSVTTQPNTPVSAAGTTTFIVQFTPSATGVRSATLSITNSDATKTPYTFAISGTGTPSNLSDITFNSGSSASTNSNIPYIDYQGTTLTNTGTGTNGSIGVMGFTVRDGGGTTDADNLGTELTAISFTVTNVANIRSARIFNGSSPVGSAVSVSGSPIVFTGLTGLTTTDGGTLALNLRVTFKSTATDRQQMQFTVSSATAAATGSQFAAANAGGAVSSNTGDINRIQVTADRLAFGQQPTTSAVSAAMTPAVTVQGVDVNGNLDIDYTGSINITSTGTLTGSPVSATAVSGVATYSSLTHTAVGTGLTLTATTTGLAFANTIGSSTFDINNTPANSYRTTAAGTWTSSGGTATWQRLISGVWTTNAAPSFGSTNNIYIRHAVDIVGSASASTIIIENGGTLKNTTAACTFGSTLVRVETGGTLWAEYSLTISGTLTVQDNADVVLNFAFSNPSTSIWSGTENFAPNSNLYIWDWNDAQPLINGNVTTNSYNGYSAAFGNVYIDLAGGTVAAAWSMFGSSTGTVNLCHGNLEIVSPNGYDIRMLTIAGTTASVGIQGNMLLSGSWSSARTFIMATSTANMTLNIKGNLELNCPGDFTVRASNSSGGGATLNIDGNLIMNGASTTSNTNFKLNQNSYGTATGNLAVVNLKGNLTVGANPTIINLGAIADQQFNFTGTSTQLVNVASGIGTGGTAGVPMFIKNNAKVQLSTNNLVLNNSSTMTVEDGGLLDFGFNGSTPLIVSNGGSGTNTFSSAQGSTLKITHQNGIVKNTANDGNVQLSVSNKTFNQTATFHYIGKANQTTGDGLSTGSTAKIVIAELADNTLTLTPSNSIAMSSTPTLDPLGGRLDIRKGIVVVTLAATITGSGRLVMIDGVYRTSILSTTVPQLSNYSNYSLTGGTVELNGNGVQTISGAPAGGYYKIAITNTGTKTVTSGFVISKNLTITNGVFDSENNAITGNAGITMTGGTFRMSIKSVTLPQLDGIDSLYNLTGGTVELYGTSSSQTHTLRGTYGAGTTITYNNVELNAIGANVGAGGANVVTGAGFNIRSGGVMNVNSPTCFQLASTFTIAGSGTFNIGAGATFKYGGTIASSGASGNIQTSTRSFPTSASYGFVGSISSQTAGTGLPASMVNMYLDKASSGNIVTLSQDAETTNSLTFYKGIVKTDANTLYVSNTATTAIVGGATSGTDKYVQGRLKWKTNSGSSYTFPVGHSAQNAQGFTITPTGTNGSDLLGYLETNSTTPTKPVAYCDLETKTGPNQQIGQGTAGPDGALDQMTFNLASPLQWDVTNPSGGVTSYNITVLANGGQDINPVLSAGGTAIRYLMKNGEPGNTGFTTATGGSDFPTVGFIACPNQYSLSGMTSFSKFTLDGATAASSSLPVKLTSFTARRVENQSQLNWATSIEIDNDRFEVERSVDATLFEKIGTVKGNGTTTSPQAYQLMDEAPIQGWNYYRLKQVDFDGKFEYSNVIALFFDGENFSVVLYPNPTKGQFTIESYGEATIFDAAIFNALGQEMRKVKTGEINYVEDLAVGNYFIKIKANNQIITKKLIIL